MAHVLPTGRNFYAIDPRTHAQPVRLAGRAAAGRRELVERHLRETGAYPRRVGLSIWGTSAMRTHGDDIAEVLALLGVRPVWQSESRRLDGVEVIPLAELGRPRVDVVCASPASSATRSRTSSRCSTTRSSWSPRSTSRRSRIRCARTYLAERARLRG